MDALLLALLVVVCCCIGWAVRIVAGDRPILGDVFRYRSPGWPSGVQEDDDLHWRWRGRSPAADRAPTEPLQPHLGFGRRPERGGRASR